MPSTRMRSLKVRSDKIEFIKRKARSKAYPRQIDLAEAIGCGQSTAHSFLNGKPVDNLNFQEFCNVLDLEYREIADFDAPSGESEGEEFDTAETPEITQQVERNNNSSSFELEYPEGAVPVDSAFYIERPPVEQRCYEAIRKPGSLIRIKAPRQMGKSSLLARILQQTKIEESVSVIVDFDIADEQFFSNLDKFLYWFCNTIIEEIGIDNPELLEKLSDKLDKRWKSCKRIGYNQTCRNYFERDLFPEIKKPLILSLETVDRLFQYPGIYKDFFALLRSVHEDTKRRDTWKQLRLVLAYSTEAYVPVDINQSPFNVGLPVELLEFTHQQVKDLARRHQLQWSDTEVESLMEVVGGHPFLVRLAMYKIAQQETNLTELLQKATTAEGIYRNHLLRLENLLKKQSELKQVMQEIVRGNNSIPLSTEVKFKLYSLGVVKLEDNQVTPRCQFYEKYFLQME